MKIQHNVLRNNKLKYATQPVRGHWTDKNSKLM
jgi:hypothetical protein